MGNHGRSFDVTGTPQGSLQRLRSWPQQTRQPVPAAIERTVRGERQAAGSPREPGIETLCALIAAALAWLA
jgi:hypothetical protein